MAKFKASAPGYGVGSVSGPRGKFMHGAGLGGYCQMHGFIFGGSQQPWLATTGQFLQAAASFGILINCVLLVLNLLPIPPLDGSRVISSLLPVKAAHVYEKIEAFGIWILLALLVFGVLSFILWPPIQWLVHSIIDLFGLGKGGL